MSEGVGEGGEEKTSDKRIGRRVLILVLVQAGPSTKSGVHDV